MPDPRRSAQTASPHGFGRAGSFSDVAPGSGPTFSRRLKGRPSPGGFGGCFAARLRLFWGGWVSRPKLAVGCPGWTTEVLVHPAARKRASGSSVQKGRGRPVPLRMATSGAIPFNASSPVPKVSARKVDPSVDSAAALWRRDSTVAAVRSKKSPSATQIVGACRSKPASRRNPLQASDRSAWTGRWHSAEQFVLFREFLLKVDFQHSAASGEGRSEGPGVQACAQEDNLRVLPGGVDDAVVNISGTDGKEWVVVRGVQGGPANVSGQDIGPRVIEKPVRPGSLERSRGRNPPTRADGRRALR